VVDFGHLACPTDAKHGGSVGSHHLIAKQVEGNFSRNPDHKASEKLDFEHNSERVVGNVPSGLW